MNTQLGHTPGLRQIFFVGDGWTGTGQGQTQIFVVPDGATRLFLGFIDLLTTQLLVPGWYGDNGGGFDETVWVDAAPTAVELNTWGKLKSLPW